MTDTTDGSDDQSALTDFGTDLAGMQTDDVMPVAEVVDAEVEPPEHTPKNETIPARLTITFQRVSGQCFAKTWDKPDEFSEGHPLFVLLSYWGLDPEDLAKLTADGERFEVPLDSRDELDWTAIETDVLEGHA